jgi:hypothetical protein
VPKLVSLFLPVAEIVEQSDKHIVLKGEDDEAIALVEAEFEGLDEDETEALKRRYVDLRSSITRFVDCHMTRVCPVT